MAPAEPCPSGWPRLLVNLGERSESEAVCRVPLLAGPAVCLLPRPGTPGRGPWEQPEWNRRASVLRRAVVFTTRKATARQEPRPPKDYNCASHPPCGHLLPTGAKERSGTEPTDRVSRETVLRKKSPFDRSPAHVTGVAFWRAFAFGGRGLLRRFAGAGNMVAAERLSQMIPVVNHLSLTTCRQPVETEGLAK